MAKPKKCPELSFKEEKNRLKAKLREQAKEIKLLKKKIEELEQRNEGKVATKSKLKAEKKKEVPLDKAAELKQKLREQYCTGRGKDETK